MKQERITIKLDAFPAHVRDTMCRILLAAAAREQEAENTKRSARDGTVYGKI